MKVTLNHAAIAELLKSPEMQAYVREVTEAVGQAVEEQGITVGDKDGGKHEYPLPVAATVVITDRAHGRVAIPHASGEAVQAKHGVLTKAAAQAGLSVRGGGK